MDGARSMISSMSRISSLDSPESAADAVEDAVETAVMFARSNLTRGLEDLVGEALAGLKGPMTDVQ